MNPYARNNPVDTAIKTFGMLDAIGRNRQADKDRKEDRSIAMQDRERNIERQAAQDKIAAEDRAQARLSWKTPEQIQDELNDANRARDLGIDIQQRALDSAATPEEARAERKLASDDKRANINYKNALVRTSQMGEVRKQAEADKAQAAQTLQLLTSVPGWENDPEAVRKYDEAHKVFFDIPASAFNDPEVNARFDRLDAAAKAGKPFDGSLVDDWSYVLQDKLNAPADEVIERELTRMGVDGKQIKLPPGTVIHKNRRLHGFQPAPDGSGGYAVVTVDATLPNGKKVTYGAVKSGSGTAGEDDDALFIPIESIGTKYAGISGARRMAAQNPKLREALKAQATPTAAGKKGAVAKDPLQMTAKEILAEQRARADKIIEQAKDAKVDMTREEAMKQAKREIEAETNPGAEAEPEDVTPEVLIDENGTKSYKLFW